MNKHNATKDLSSPFPSKPNPLKDYVYYIAGRKGVKLDRVAPTKVGKRPIYKFFKHLNRKCLPLKCMLDLRSTSFVNFPEAAK
jgi:hypothetical protein